MVKHKKLKLNVIPFSIILGILIVGLISYNFYVVNNVESKPSTPNELGLATLGLIPTVPICTHNQSAYELTDVGVRDSNGAEYVLLKSKFGDEYCPIRIK